MRDTLAEYFSPADIHGQVAGHLFPASLVESSFYEPGKGDEARARGLYQRQRNAQGVVYGELLVNEHADT